MALACVLFLALLPAPAIAGNEDNPEIHDERGDAPPPFDSLAGWISDETQDTFNVNMLFAELAGPQTCGQYNPDPETCPEVFFHYQFRFQYSADDDEYLSPRAPAFFVGAAVDPETGEVTYHAGRVLDDVDHDDVREYESLYQGLPGTYDAQRGLIVITANKAFIGDAVPSGTEMFYPLIATFAENEDEDKERFDRAPDFEFGDEYEFGLDYFAEDILASTHPTVESPVLYLHSGDSSFVGQWMNSQREDPSATDEYVVWSSWFEVRANNGCALWFGSDGRCEAKADFTLLPRPRLPLLLEAGKSIVVGLEAEVNALSKEGSQSGLPLPKGAGDLILVDLLMDDQVVGHAETPFSWNERRQYFVEVDPSVTEVPAGARLALTIEFRPVDSTLFRSAFLFTNGSSAMVLPIVGPTANDLLSELSKPRLFDEFGNEIPGPGAVPEVLNKTSVKDKDNGVPVPTWAAPLSLVAAAALLARGRRRREG